MKTFFAAAAAWLAACFCAFAQQTPTAPTCAQLVRVDRIHDADTIFGVIDKGDGVLLDCTKTGIRAAGYDAFEVSRVRHSSATESQPITDDEIAKGKIARDELARLMAMGQFYVEPSESKDPHGRVLATYWIKLPNGWLHVGSWMQAHGHCRTSHPASTPAK
jgi:hypothetical protein